MYFKYVFQHTNEKVINQIIMPGDQIQADKKSLLKK